jgi:hypothetical protein
VGPVAESYGVGRTKDPTFYDRGSATPVIGSPASQHRSNKPSNTWALAPSRETDAQTGTSTIETAALKTLEATIAVGLAHMSDEQRAKVAVTDLLLLFTEVPYSAETPKPQRRPKPVIPLSAPAPGRFAMLARARNQNAECFKSRKSKKI